MYTKVTYRLFKIFGLIFSLVPILMSRLNMFSDIPMQTLIILSTSGFILLIIGNIIEWNFKKGIRDGDYN